MKKTATINSENTHGWRGRILQVDLSNSKIWEEKLSEELINGYIGGAGINAKLFYDLMRDNPQLDPLSPENPLIFGFGPVVGTAFPCASRFTVTSKSPLTGIFGDSNGGGFFPARVKQAGYDHIVIKGKAEKPVALLIEKDKKPELVDATDLWGLDTYATDETIQKKYGSCESARIGPAGENMVRYANILSGTKRIGCNGRAGMGCVMGSKNLKAIIVKASGTVPSADKDMLGTLAKKYGDIWGSGPSTTAHREYGSLMLIAQLSNETRVLNSQEKISPEQLESYDIDNFVKTYKDGQTTCYRCPIACSMKWKVAEGPYKGEKGGKFEFGHYNHLGPLLGIFDYPSLLHLSNMTNQMGMDCIQFGWNLAMAMECFQRGILSSEETGGITFNWGDVQLVSDMIVKVAKREGFGNILAESMPEISSKLNPDATPYCGHTKGMSFSYNCTSALAMTLASSVGTRGADHLKGHPFSGIIGLRDMLERIFGKDIPDEITDHASPISKGRVVWWHENYKMLMDCLGICFIPIVGVTVFGDPHMLFEELGEIYQAVTGRNPEKLFESAERAYQVEKCYNALLGIDRKADVRQGTRRGQEDPINQPGMLDEYYHYRGCSSEGLPTRKRLKEVGLSDTIEDLIKKGKLAEHECPDIKELLPKTTKS
ncbi:MAG: aldehyde ferredoxin oxidoreductase family protein [Deltaproteobacteria bacterium]|nr:aldehyde ferredoxin oxidoreductase family protein [Deltaproteobacteria bacterium]